MKRVIGLVIVVFVFMFLTGCAINEYTIKTFKFDRNYTKQELLWQAINMALNNISGINIMSHDTGLGGGNTLTFRQDINDGIRSYSIITYMIISGFDKGTPVIYIKEAHEKSVSGYLTQERFFPQFISDVLDYYDAIESKPPEGTSRAEVKKMLKPTPVPLDKTGTARGRDDFEIRIEGFARGAEALAVQNISEYDAKNVVMKIFNTDDRSYYSKEISRMQKKSKGIHYFNEFTSMKGQSYNKSSSSIDVTISYEIPEGSFTEKYTVTK